jgi:hypothetical protein
MVTSHSSPATISRPSRVFTPYHMSQTRSRRVAIEMLVIVSSILLAIALV